MNFIEYIVSGIIGYLIGSIPTAYLLLKKAHNIKITDNGSGNVGAFNSYRITNSKLTALSVFIIDALKGMISVVLVKYLFDNHFILMAIALIMAVFAHCFSPWINFKGGRGLATAAGGSVILIPGIFIVWGVLWTISFIFRKNIYFSSIAASILTAAIAISSADILNKYSFPPATSSLIFATAVTLLMTIILSRHIGYIKEWISLEKTKSGIKRDEKT